MTGSRSEPAEPAEPAEPRSAYDELVASVDALGTQLRDLEAEVARLRTNVGGAGSRFAALYPDFQERFRGPVEEVRAKLAGYLPDVQRVARGGGLLDLGSGRGEWLGLLRDAGLAATGVDSHPERVAAARAGGFDVTLDDAVGHLRSRAPGELDLVTAFHLVEHLDVDEVLELLHVASVALRPGGCLLLETPNATNLVTGACDFYCDPTHRRPLPPTVAEWMVGAAGFVDVEVRHLHPKASPFAPYADETHGDAAPLVQQVVEAALFGPQDYAVLGFRPAE